jgi:hypothetical protein
MELTSSGYDRSTITVRGSIVKTDRALVTFDNGVVVLTRQRETLIGIVTMVTLPLTFLSSALMQQSLLPGRIGWIGTFNPVNWAAEAGRSAAAPNADCGLIATRAGFLALLLASGGDPAVREATASAAGLWRPQSRVSTR